MPRIEEKVVRKYLKILALAQGSAGNEQQTAARMVAGMEAKHPGIRAVAARAQSRQAGQAGQAGGPHSWGDFFSFLGDVYTDFSGAVRTAMAGAKLARTVRFSRTTRVGGTYVSVRLPTKTIMELRTLEQGQKDIFRAELIQRFDSEIQALIES